MPKYIVVRIDKNKILNSYHTIIATANIKLAYIKGYLEISDDDLLVNEDVFIDDLEINSDETRAGINFNNESWYITKLS